jgi:type II secretory pathway pseudopilin PulG
LKPINFLMVVAILAGVAALVGLNLYVKNQEATKRANQTANARAVMAERRKEKNETEPETEPAINNV